MYRRRLLAHKKSGGVLPAGYRQVEWIKGGDIANTPYWFFPFGFDFSNALTLEIKCQAETTSNQNGFFMASANKSIRMIGIAPSNNGKKSFRYNNTYYVTTLNADLNIHTYSVTPNGGYVDETYTIAAVSSSYTGAAYFFSGYYNGTVYSAPARLYGVRVLNGSAVLFDGIMCLDSNDIPCMYDTVSGNTFYNAGSGQFNYGGFV